MASPNNTPTPPHTAQPRRALWALLAVVCCLGASCESADEARERIVQRHRQQALGRVGVLRGLEVHERAVRLSRAIQSHGDGRCASLPSGPFEAHLRIEAEVTRPGAAGSLEKMLELRTLTRTSEGALSARFEVEFINPAGRASQWSREERVLDDAHYVREENLPFVAHKAHRGDRERLLRSWLDPIPALLSAGGRGWKRLGTGETWTAQASDGGARFQCGLSDDERGWLRRFLETARMSYAETSLPLAPSGDVRRRSASARFEVGEAQEPWVVRLDVEEKVFYRSPPTVEKPEETGRPGRDRPVRDLREILIERLKLEALDLR